VFEKKKKRFIARGVRMSLCRENSAAPEHEREARNFGRKKMSEKIQKEKLLSAWEGKKTMQCGAECRRTL